MKDMLTTVVKHFRSFTPDGAAALCGSDRVSEQERFPADAEAAVLDTGAARCCA